MTARRARLDAELVRRGLARSRAQAAELIAAGQVAVAGQAAEKAATQVGLDAAITVRRAAQEPEYVSRGGHKLAGALAVFGEPSARPMAGGESVAVGESVAGRESVAGSGAAAGSGAVAGGESVAGRGAAAASQPAAGSQAAGTVGMAPGLTVRGRRCLDAGASTGGFTDVLLRAGAGHVVAADVGYGQLAWSLRSDPRVTVVDRVNIRNLQPEQVAPPPELITADLSFISLTTVLPALVACATPDADFVLLVKPQFEVGKGHVGSGGVVRDRQLRGSAVQSVAEAAAELGLGVRGVTASPLPGPSGNVEYFLWLTRDAPPLKPGDLRQAIENGPQ